MNEVINPIYLDLLDKGKFDTEESTNTFFKAYDYIIDMAECEDNNEEKEHIFALLSEIENQSRRTAFQVGIYTAFQMFRFE
ncbi:MAG: hypothetical protein IJZ64_00930 [Ruminococcus sp.]|nr:hypothetical protein [Ruminococcus sp.]